MACPVLALCVISSNTSDYVTLSASYIVMPVGGDKCIMSEYFLRYSFVNTGSFRDAGFAIFIGAKIER